MHMEQNNAAFQNQYCNSIAAYKLHIQTSLEDCL